MNSYDRLTPQSSRGLAPAVKSVSGLGTGGGAGVASYRGGGDADAWEGEIDLLAGTGAGTSGSVVLHFPVAPSVRTYWGALNDDGVFGAVTATLNGADLTLAWVLSSGAGFLPGKRYRMRYESR